MGFFFSQYILFALNYFWYIFNTIVFYNLAHTKYDIFLYKYENLYIFQYEMFERYA